jgi:flagellar biosynthesis/type III secretory pathway M-ring protein FliF/YscJ
MQKKNRSWLVLVLAVIAFIIAFFVLVKVSVHIELPTSAQDAR